MPTVEDKQMKQTSALDKSTSRSNWLLDFLIFKRMLGSWLFIMTYWLIVLIIIGSGGLSTVVWLIISKEVEYGTLIFIGGVILSLSSTLLSLLVWRIIFEVMIILFQIHETLRDIHDKL